MTFSDLNAMIQTLSILTLMPLPIILGVSVIVRLLFPKYDHRQ